MPLCARRSRSLGLARAETWSSESATMERLGPKRRRIGQAAIDEQVVPRARRLEVDRLAAAQRQDGQPGEPGGLPRLPAPNGCGRAESRRRPGTHVGPEEPARYQQTGEVAGEDQAAQRHRHGRVSCSLDIHRTLRGRPCGASCGHRSPQMMVEREGLGFEGVAVRARLWGEIICKFGVDACSLIG